MIDEHNNNVVMMLQSKLATTSMTFKDVLELRTQVFVLFVLCQRKLTAPRKNMKESKSRTEQFMYTTQVAANQTPSCMFISSKSESDVEDHE